MGNKVEEIASIYDIQTNVTEIVPFVCHLLQDPVAKVRRETLTEVPKVIKSLSSAPDKQIEFIMKIQKLVTDSFHHRLVFTKICNNVDQFDIKIFGEYFLPHLLSLVNDKVPNVRLNVAGALKSALTKDISPLHRDSILKALETLKKDNDNDVKLSASI